MIAFVLAVNLLNSVPTTIAVSSTVENATILPAHIADGKLDTAWNSVTGELDGAWIGVKVPDDAIVESVKLTVGFTKVDKKWGDLFTMNPRIKTVRILHDDKYVTEVNLDTNSRDLQEIKVGKLKGGKITIQIQRHVDGTKKDWREINISELEVWGTPGASTPPKATKPTVYVGAFTHSVLTKAQCLAVMPAAKGAKLARVESIDLTDDIAICRVETFDPTATDKAAKASTIATLGAVKRGGKLALLGKVPDIKLERYAASDDEAMNGTPSKEATLALDSYPLTTSESALRVVVETSESTMHSGGSTSTTTLYRFGKTATKILEMGSSGGGSSNGGSSRTCTLDDVSPLTATIPAKIVEHCELKHEGYPGSRDEHGKRTDPDWTKSATSTFVWKKDAYEEQLGPDDNTDAPPDEP